jgi:DNA 3'-phosphatase
MQTFGPKPEPKGDKFFLFDLDGTLVLSRSGQLYSRSIEDTLILPAVPDKLAALRAEGYNLLIVTHQAYYTPAVHDKLDWISNTLNVPLIAATGDKSPHRKPSPSMWNYYCGRIRIFDRSKLEIHFCGDASGPTSDYSPYKWNDCDRKFAEAIGATFHEPLDVFPLPRVPDSPLVKTVSIMVGNPGSGKSNFARQLCAKERGLHVHIEADVCKTRTNTLKAAETVLSLGLSVIIDATHASKARRQECYDLAAKFGCTARIFWLPRDGRSFNDTRPKPVPPVAYATYSKHFEDPREDGVPLYLLH